MIRDGLIKKNPNGEPHFRWRGGDVSRLEALADAVFALSLTLLVVSLEVPRSFDELKAAFVQLPVFAVCFAMLYMICHAHFQFHRRYGLEDAFTSFLNALLLFVVLFYVYPLKFLFSVLYTVILHGGPWQLDGKGEPMVVETARGTRFVEAIDGADMPTLMILYGGGFAGVYLIFWLATWWAWRKRDVLELDEAERVTTRWTMSGHLIMLGVGTLSAIYAWLGIGPAAVSGFLYFLIGPLRGIHGWRQGVAVEAAVKRQCSSA